MSLIMPLLYFSHALILGRLTSGEGGTIILEEAQKVLRKEFPDLNKSITFHQPDEKNKRHGQRLPQPAFPQSTNDPFQ